jgi:hypothetical protein
MPPIIISGINHMPSAPSSATAPITASITDIIIKIRLFIDHLKHPRGYCSRLAIPGM